MLRARAASPALSRTILAFGLCLLAIVFAVEAKTAWFGPALGVGSDIQAAKALPADMPKVIEHGIPVPDPIHPQVPFALLTALVAEQLTGTATPTRNLAPAVDFAVSEAAYFSPAIFFRPPPSLS